MKILMVCLGNICRSPLAQGILQSKVDTSVHVDSAGTGNWHVGSKPDERSIKIASKYGVDISGQKARQFTVKDFDVFDRIYVMDQTNFDNILALAQNEIHHQKVKLILSEIPDFELSEVPDPYYGGVDGFEFVYRILDQATDHIIKSI